MKSKHEAFYKTYFAAKSQEQQLELMKQYMLSLSSEELSDFLLEDIRALSKHVKENKLSRSEREMMIKGLDDCLAIFGDRAKARMEAV